MDECLLVWVNRRSFRFRFFYYMVDGSRTVLTSIVDVQHVRYLHLSPRTEEMNESHS